MKIFGYFFDVKLFVFKVLLSVLVVLKKVCKDLPMTGVKLITACVTFKKNSIKIYKFF